MSKKRTVQGFFITLFTLLFIISFALAGCAPAEETAAGSAGTFGSAGTAAVGTQAATEAADEGISYVSIDINPSIELTVKYGIVLDAAAYNDDGAEILLSADVVGLTPEEAIAALIAEFAAQGYITPDSTDAAIVITVYGDDEDELLANLRTTAIQSLTGLGISCDIAASAVEPDIAHIAKAAGITPGKYLLIKYLADQDGITIEEARDIYGGMKMKELLALIPDPGKVFGEDAYIYLSSLVQGLTPEQLQILTQAQIAYKAAMKAAVKTYNQAKEDARASFHAARSAAQDAFKKTRDQQAWQQAKTAAKQQMELMYQAAKQAFAAAKAQAKEAFMLAVSGLGLTEEQIKALLEWDFDLEWDVGDDWGEGQDIESDDQDEDEDEGHGHGNGQGRDKDDDEESD
jgi:hypothetical protein